MLCLQRVCFRCAHHMRDKQLQRLARGRYVVHSGCWRVRQSLALEALDEAMAGFPVSGADTAIWDAHQLLRHSR